MTSPCDLHVPEHLSARIEVQQSGCWLWLGGKTVKGYGRIQVDGRSVYAHRLLFQLTRDASLQLSPGRGTDQQLDHVNELCSVGPSCVNPLHLERVTNRTNNQRRSVSSLGYSGAKVVGNCVYAAIRHRSHHVHLGVAESPAHAGRLYDAACVALGDTPANYAAGRLPDPPTPELVAAMRERIERKAAA